MEKEDWGKLKTKDEDWYSENRHRFFIWKIDKNIKNF